MSEFLNHVPYCGLPPLPAEIWTRWNLDPVLIATLAVLIAAHGLRLRSRPAAHMRRQWTCFIAGWTAVALGLISPLCALSVALFSARVTQHMWLTLIAAPLLVLAEAAARGSRVRARVGPLTAAGLFAIALWGWHLPALYDLTFRHDLAYWLMHITLTGTAVLLWRAVFFGGTEAWLGRLAAGSVTMVHMGLLGALITFAPRLLYQAHLLSAQPWGLSPLEDQQVGGLIMWIPAGVVLLIAGLALVYGALSLPSDRSEVDIPRAPTR